MSSEITTEGIIERFQKLINAFVGKINKSKSLAEYPEYTLLIQKIIVNLLNSNALWARGSTRDALILVRTGYESLVLLFFLKQFPDRTEEYRLDSEIVQYKTVFSCYKRNLASLEEFTELYSSLSQKAKLKISSTLIDKDGRIISFQKNKLDKFFKDFKPIAQRTTYMLKELERVGNIHGQNLNYFSILLYGANSELVHGLFHILPEYVYELDPNSCLNKIADCFRQSLFIVSELYNFLIEFDSEVFKEQCKELEWYKLGLELYDYLGIEFKESCEQAESSFLSEIITIAQFSNFKKPTR